MTNAWIKTNKLWFMLFQLARSCRYVVTSLLNPRDLVLLLISLVRNES